MEIDDKLKPADGTFLLEFFLFYFDITVGFIVDD